MNDSFELPQTPEPIFPVTPAPPVVREAAKPWTYWARRFLACNPFYLVSAALLLYGFYRVSIDTSFFRQETAQLWFNFTSLQFYEGLLVIAAIFLARRRIWYDSTLLVCLENLFVLVPFILITQAALINTRLVWALCLGAGIVTVIRFGSLRRFIAELNFPRRLVIIGLLVLAVNVVLPVVYRILNEHKSVSGNYAGTAYNLNCCAWLLALPMLCALMNFLPRARNAGGLLPQRGWLGPGWFSLWLTGTIVHLYCLGYVYDLSLRLELIAPAVWVLLWSLQHKSASLVVERAPEWKPVLLVLPVLATFLGISSPRSEVFLTLTILNAAIYGGICLYRRDERLAVHLLFISLVALVAGLPEEWGRSVLAGFNRGKCIGAGITGYFLLWVAFSRNPKLAVFATLVIAGTFSSLVEGPNALHWTSQAALVFLLLHSLRWVDSEHAGARAARILAGGLWVAHSCIWMRTGGAAWMVCAVAVLVLGAYLIARVLSGRWASFVIPAAAFLVMLTGPGDFTARQIQAAPAGLLAMIGSFLLFGLGTLVALTRNRRQQ
jgi:hypothetical protein